MELFAEMAGGGIAAIEFPFHSVLHSAAALGLPSLGRQLHSLLLKTHIFLANALSAAALLALYCKHLPLSDARKLFDEMPQRNAAACSTLIAAYTQRRRWPEAVEMLLENAGGWGSSAIAACLTAVLPHCGMAGPEIHALACKRGLQSHTAVCNGLIAMYARRGELSSSEKVFQRVGTRDIVTWNTMAASRAIAGDLDGALGLFSGMRASGVNPDQYSYGALFDGCGRRSALRRGEALHADAAKRGVLPANRVAGTALVDMYGKCGKVEESRKMFEEMPERDIVAWNAVISACGLNARPSEAAALFQVMVAGGRRPNGATFVGLLAGLAHAGASGEGLRLLAAMPTQHGVAAGVEHYTCVVDGLARAGRLDEALGLIEAMPVAPDGAAWGALLGGCRVHGAVGLAEVAARRMAELEPGHAGAGVLLAGVYAGARRWEDAARARRAVGGGGAGGRKERGMSWVEAGNGEMHGFSSGDGSHGERARVYGVLDGLTEQLMDEGYVPSLDAANLRFPASDEGQG